MDAVAITVGISWTLVGLLGITLSIPLIKGQIGRNKWYGVRFPQSFQSEESWLAINRFGGKRLAFWSIPLLAIGVVSFFLPLQTHTELTLVLGFAPLVFVLIPLLESWHLARRFRQTA